MELKKKVEEYIKNYQWDKALDIVPQHDNSKNVEKIRKIMKEVRKLQSILDEPMDKWKKQPMGKQLNLYSYVQGSNIFFRFEGYLEFHVFNFLAIIYQMRYYEKWVPFCKQSRQIKKIGIAQKIGNMKFQFPIISNRIVFLHGIGVDLIQKQNKIIIYAYSVTNNRTQQVENKINLSPKQNEVELDLKYVFCEIKMVGKKKHMIRFISEADIKYRMIPEWCLGFFSKQAGKYLFQKLLKYANNFQGTQWQQTLKNPSSNEFYCFIEKLVKRMIQNN